MTRAAIALGLVIAGLVALGRPATAQSLTLSPAVVPLGGRPGQSTSQRLTLFNGTSFPMSFALVAKDVVVRDGARVFVGAGSGVDPVRETIPAGFDISAVATPTLQLVAGQPVQLDVLVPANRSIAGTVRGAPATGGSVTVTVVELGRTAEVDAAGRYVFRGLKPGRYTIEVTLDGKALRRVVELAAGPGAVRDIDFP
jgi:hypothetical protein